MVIKSSEVQWLTRHTMDPLGEVFRYENRIFRIINDEKREYVIDLFNKGIMKEMIEKGFFVNTWINEDVRIEGRENSLVLEHSVVPHLSVRYEWSVNMFIELRTMIARFSIWLLQHGYELLDCHAWNVAFIGCKPIYMDLGSIVPSNSCGLTGWRIFKNEWVDRLRWIEQQRMDDKLFRALNFSGMVLQSENISGLIGSHKAKIEDIIEYRLYDNSIKSPRKIIEFAANTCRNILKIDNEKTNKYKIRRYRKYAEFKRIQCKDGMRSSYSDQGVEGKQIINDERFSFYVSLIKNLKEKDNIKTSFEIAGNAGLLSQLLLEHDIVEHACVSDYDVKAIDNGFLRCRDNENVKKKISFAVIDIMSTIENITNISYQRYKSDIVIALAVTNHLILAQNVKLSVIVDILERYTKKYVVVEFMPLGLWAGDDENCPPIPKWYTFEWFLDGLKTKFDIVVVEQISKNRICVLGQRK